MTFNYDSSNFQPRKIMLDQNSDHFQKLQNLISRKISEFYVGVDIINCIHSILGENCT